MKNLKLLAALNAIFTLFIIYASYFTIYNWKSCVKPLEYQFTNVDVVKNLRIYVLPNLLNDASSELFRKILSSTISSKYSSNDSRIPDQLCLIPYDTIDRDPLSVNFVWNLDYKIKQLTSIEDFRYTCSDFLIFNMFAGSWPIYNESAYFADFSSFYVAKSSMRISTSSSKEISFPLFHISYPHKSYYPLQENENHVLNRGLLLSFKGKRYVRGYGSDVRNLVHIFHNQRDIVMLTTCRHGYNWYQYADKKCNWDMNQYDKYDYNKLLEYSKFCLIPRGRRLGSFRFLESLKFNCIPIIMSNDWKLPFSDVIDWTEAAVIQNELSTMEMTDVINFIPDSVFIKMRKRIAFLWRAYFSSIDRIVETTLKLIEYKLNNFSIPFEVWNQPPGALVYSAHSLHTSPCSYPLKNAPNYCSRQFSERFTMIIHVDKSICKNARWVAEILYLADIDDAFDIVILHSCLNYDEIAVNYLKYKGKVIIQRINSSIERFHIYDEIHTYAVFSVNFKDINALDTDMIKSMFMMWQNKPHSIVGVLGYLVIPNEKGFNNIAQTSLACNLEGTSNSNCLYSTASWSLSFYHKYYHKLFFDTFDIKDLDKSTLDDLCLDTLFNLMIIHIHREPPFLIRLKTYPDSLLDDHSLYQLSKDCPLLNRDFNFKDALKIESSESLKDIFRTSNVYWSV